MDDQALLALDADGVGVSGIRDADQGRPVRPNGMLGGVTADLVLGQDRLNEAGQGLGWALFGATGFVKRDAAEISDEFLGQATEGMGFLSHR